VTQARATSGLTVVEVLLALAVIGIVTAAFTTAVVGNLKHTQVAGARTEAVQILNYLGRRAAGGDSAVLPAAGGTLSWGYGSLSTAFPDLTDHGGLTDPSRYSAQVSNPGDVSLAGATAGEYDVKVCYKAGDGQHCVVGATMGLYPSSGSSSVQQIPGIY
jgi:type II secretory pathway pseudopilin PulG